MDGERMGESEEGMKFADEAYDIQWQTTEGRSDG